MSKHFSFGRVLLIIIVLVFSAVVSRVFYLVGDYYGYLDAYSGDVVRGDQPAAQDDLEKLKYFYQLNNKLKPFGLSWLADRYFFEDAVYQATAYDYLTNRHEKVIGDLKSENSFWGYYLRANSKWRLAQGVFAQSLQKETATRLKEQLEAVELALSAKEDYEEAVKITKGEHLGASWNYDLMTNAAKMKAALQPKPAVVKIRLGIGGRKNKGSGQDKGQGPEGNDSQDLKIEGPPTEGKPKPRTKRPG